MAQNPNAPVSRRKAIISGIVFFFVILNVIVRATRRIIRSLSHNSPQEGDDPRREYRPMPEPTTTGYEPVEQDASQAPEPLGVNTRKPSLELPANAGSEN